MIQIAMERSLNELAAASSFSDLSIAICIISSNLYHKQQFVSLAAIHILHSLGINCS